MSTRDLIQEMNLLLERKQKERLPASDLRRLKNILAILTEDVEDEIKKLRNH